MSCSKIRKISILPLLTIALISCSKTKQSLMCVCPKGAPALSFYNVNFEEIEFRSEPTLVLSELQKNDFDMVVFDSINGLKSCVKNKANYALAKLITGGNFYLVGIDVKPLSDGSYPLPKSDDIVVSFGQNLIPDLVYSKLCSDFWHIENNAHYVNSVNDALAVLKSGRYSGGNANYVFIAEPALTAALNDKTCETYGKVNIVKNIRSEWKIYSGQDGLAQAGIFVNKSSYEKRKDELHKYIVNVENAIETAINDPLSVKHDMDSKLSLNEQIEKYGFNSNTVLQVQSDNRNGFGLVGKNESIDVNKFLEYLGQSPIPEDYFIEV
ncbi:MAG: hypothetical protein MJ221_00315 [Bacilli bacterium]|nr:hypothetical protein [Bacilli bacterium]